MKPYHTHRREIRNEARRIEDEVRPTDVSFLRPPVGLFFGERTSRSRAFSSSPSNIAAIMEEMTLHVSRLASPFTISCSGCPLPSQTREASLAALHTTALS
jgi:hypothetical protein